MLPCTTQAAPTTSAAAAGLRADMTASPARRPALKPVNQSVAQQGAGSPNANLPSKRKLF